MNFFIVSGERLQNNQGCSKTVSRGGGQQSVPTLGRLQDKEALILRETNTCSPGFFSKP